MENKSELPNISPSRTITAIIIFLVGVLLPWLALAADTEVLSKDEEEQLFWERVGYVEMVVGIAVVIWFAYWMTTRKPSAPEPRPIVRKAPIAASPRVSRRVK